MKSRRLFILSLVSLLGLLLSGCSGTQQAQKTATPQPTPAPLLKVVLFYSPL